MYLHEMLTLKNDQIISNKALNIFKEMVTRDVKNENQKVTL